MSIVSTVLLDGSAPSPADGRDAGRYRRLRTWGVAPNASSGITAMVFRSQALDSFVDRDLERRPCLGADASAPGPARPVVVAVGTLAIDGPPDVARKVASRILGTTDSGLPLRTARIALLAEWESTSPRAVTRDAQRYRRLRTWGYAPRSGHPTLISLRDLDDLIDRDLEIYPTTTVAEPRGSAP